MTEQNHDGQKEKISVPESSENLTPEFDISSPSYAMYRLLKDLCLNNANFFQQDDSEYGQRLAAGFLALIDHTDNIAPQVHDVRCIAPQYDLDENSPGNGYRSFVTVVDLCILHGVKLNRQICDNRYSFLFRKSFYMREVEACGHVLAALGTCMQHLKTLISWSKPDELFPGEEHSPEELLKKTEGINMYCFYGRCLGFQFCESMQKVLKTLCILMASFSEIYYGNGGILARATNSMWTGGKYFLDPELRARRIVNISQNAGVDFCKTFWRLSETEMMSRLPAMVCPAVAVNKVISIPPEQMEHENRDGTKISIPIPTAHLGPAPINVRLLSAVRREGMIGNNKERNGTVLPPSPGLIVHSHGGGFVAQSSRSHEMYLRDWAVQLGVPILSVDYSLAPNAPFPRALEEVLYAYCWAINNAHILGSTAERIILVGDSAGANLNIGVTMKCIELGIQPPSGLFLAYVPVLVSFVPSPSRLLCLMDPLLPFGFMIRCLKAYAYPKPLGEYNENIKWWKGKNQAPKSTDSAVNSSQVCWKGFNLCCFASYHNLSNEHLEAYACPNEENSDSLTYCLRKEGSALSSNVTASDTESFEEVSESDLLELAAHKSGSDTLTTVSLTSLQSKPEGDQVMKLDNGSVDSKDTDRKSNGMENGNSQSEQYVSEFLEKYVLDSDTDSEGRKVPVLRTEPGANLDFEENILFEVPAQQQNAGGLSTKFGRAVGSIASGVSNTFNYVTGRGSPITPAITEPRQNRSRSLGSESLQALDSMMQRSPSEELHFTVPKDPYLSPYWASDEVLQQFPRTSILSVQLDPCLDDCVMFAKRLKKLGNKVTLDVLDGLPHGFLNFSLLSREARVGSNRCVQRIQDLLSC